MTDIFTQRRNCWQQFSPEGENVGADGDRRPPQRGKFNPTDEIAFLSFDRERGTRARIGFLTHQPRTSGVSARLDV